ncbi:MAG: hypothetical protein KDA75_09235 [Planctomycetaceae bacterium]|nr:hypothetical protein [Planctomycetaceae bacterium]
MPLPGVRSRRRRLAFVAGTVLIVLLITEGLARLGLYLSEGTNWQSDQLLLANQGLEREDYRQIPHPYVGIITPPTLDTDHVDDALFVNVLGFPLRTPPVQKCRSDRLLVGIVGGSVARHFATYGGRRLREQLTKSPLIAGRNVDVICLANEGFKQPQQLMAVNYSLSLGGEFDIVVNLDGFNELVVADGNYQVEANTAYPRSWRFATAKDEWWNSSRGVFQMRRLQRERRELADDARLSPWRFLALRQLWWRIRDIRLRDQFRLAAQESSRSRADSNPARDFGVLGPREKFASDEELLSRLTSLWEDSSRQLQHLAAGERFLFLHCLQPTALLEESKSLSRREQTIVGETEMRQKELVRAGYPQLRTSAVRLAAHGEQFRDLTNVFADVTETVYVDACHLNQRGNDLLAERIAQEILDAWPGK